MEMTEMTRKAVAGLAVAALIVGGGGCGESKTKGDAQNDADAAADPEADEAEHAAEPDVDADAEPEVEPEDVPEDAGEDVEEEEVEWSIGGLDFPQAVDGAFWANPDVYAEIPLHVLVHGLARAVTVRLGSDTYGASDEDGDGDWIVMLPIADLPDGFTEVEATASAPGEDPASLTADLGIGRSGVQLTVFDEVGFAGTPTIHRVDDRLWLTWTDRSDGTAEAWLRRIDGAGRWIGDRIPIVGSDEETLYARTAFGSVSIGVLYQQHGSPYTTTFKTVDLAGAELVSPIPLDPPGWSGSFGGAVGFDGAAYVVVWRVNDGAEGGQVLWARIDEGTGTTQTPVVVAEAGTGDPIGGFEPFSFVSLAVRGEISLVGFVRERYSETLLMGIPKSQIARVRSDGTLEDVSYAGVDRDFTWHREARVFAPADSFLAVWSAVDLSDPSDNPPNLFYATRTDTAGVLDPARGRGVVMFDAVDDRDEPFFLPHPVHVGILMWIDHRAYTLDPPNGRIELYAAPVGDDLTTGEETVFPHARFVAGLAHLNAAPAGTNAVMVWSDERHGLGILDPKPEMYMETAWY
jgi:hypothetical protein